MTAFKARSCWTFPWNCHTAWRW